jgi:hypothetical protein
MRKDDNIPQGQQRKACFLGKGCICHGKPLFEMFKITVMLAQKAKKQGFALKN